jgi:hypothetical protein
MTVSLVDDVSRFVDEVSGALATLSGRPAYEHRREAIIEAADIIAGVIAADGRYADAELRAYLDAVGDRLDPPLAVTPQRLREGRSLEDRERWLRQPSVLFDLLAKADGRDSARRSHRYYELALRLTHVTAAIDLVPSTDELAAIDGFRSTMLSAMDEAGINRPGQPTSNRHITPTPTPGVGTPPAATATTAEAPVIEVELPPARGIEELLAELDALVGLANVKAEVRRLTSLLQVQQLRAERGLPTMEASHHLVFSGNPGTGKTTVARLLSQIYRAVGVVSKGHLVETDRAELVAGYVGQTALKTRQTLEAVDEMADLIDTNPGLKSRFTRTINFPDYTTDELVRIFDGLGARHHYTCSDSAAARVRELIEAEPRTRGFGNARFVRNLFETAVSHQAMRVAPLTDPSDEQLTTLVATDIAPVDA